MNQPPKILYFQDLKDKGIPYSANHLDTLMDKHEFPKTVPVGKRRRGWVETEIDAWIWERIAQRDASPDRVIKTPHKRKQRAEA